MSGAGIAGPALACSLVRAGVDVTVVERSDELREEGQNVDVRGSGREVARRLGIEDEIRANHTTETATEFVDADGEVASRFPAGGDDSPTAELEILRGRLSRLLHDRSADRARYVFGDAVEEVGDDGRVGFASGREERFDVVVVAEGQRSPTRDRLFDGVELQPLGVDIAYLTIPRREDDTDTWRWYIAPGGRQVSLRPDDVGTIRVMLAFETEPKGYDELDRADQARLLRERFADAGWQADRVLDALDEADLYYESLAQVQVPSWSRGRVVLAGDAAHCVTPIAGFGSSLALVGAWILAGELVTAPDHATAFRRYEERLRPFAEDVADLPPGVPGIAYPRTELGAGLLRLATKAAASPVGRAVAGLIPSSPKAIELPDYSPIWDRE